MKKKIVAVIGCAMLLTGCGKVSTLKNGEDAVVSFDDDQKIGVTELYNVLKDKYGIAALIDLIDEFVLNKEYPNSEADKTKYVDDNIKNIKANFETDEEFLSAVQQYYGISTEDEFKELLGLSYLRNLAVEDYAKTLVTEKEAKKYYEDNIVGDIKCSHILIKVTTTDDMTDDEKSKVKDTALAKAKNLIKQLKKAENLEETFAKLAKENSEDDGSKDDGGSLGFFNKGQMVAEFETAAYKLKKGEYTTTPVLTTYGYHIILKVDEKEKASFDDSKDSIYKTLGSEKVTADTTVQIDALTELRKSYGMDIEDSDLHTAYANYIQSLIANATKTAEQ